MKIVIDIDENVYTRLFDKGIQDNEISVDDVCEMARALRIGKPFDSVIEEIKAEKEKYREEEEPHLCDYRYHRNEGLDMALDVIDKYIKE